MFDRRPALVLLVGLMLCISVWRMSIQEPNLVADYTSSETVDIASLQAQNITSNAEVTANSQQLLQHTATPQRPNQMPKDDRHSLIDLTNFDYIINQPACIDHTRSVNDEYSQLPFVLILIHSAPLNWHKRNVIRYTWGQQDSRARIFFLLGAVNTTQLQHRLRQENDMFQDIIQGNFIDAYRNMTYKHIMALKWFTYNCPKLKYLVKTDDDVFVNTPALYEYLEKSGDRQNFLFCSVKVGAPIKRSYRSKWRVSPKEFAGRYYPPYCPGYSIVYSADVVFRLYKEAQRTRYFWIDDVHVTGTLAQKNNINITALGKYFMNEEQRDSIFNHISNLEEPKFLFTAPNLVESQIRQLWNLILPKTNNNNKNENEPSNINDDDFSTTNNIYDDEAVREAKVNR